MRNNQIYDYVERIGEVLRVDARQAGAEAGLQPVQLEVLHYLSLCNQYSDTPMAVTEYLGQTRGTVSQTLKVLEKKGLVGKRVDQRDKRVTHLKLTEQGRNIVDLCIPTPKFISACELIGEKDEKQMISALKTLLNNLLAANQMKTFGICKSCRYNESRKDGSYFCNLVQVTLSSEDVELICREHEPDKTENCCVSEDS